MNGDKADSILVFRIGQMGDALVSLPAIRAIRKRHPDSRMVLFTDVHDGKRFTPSWEVFEPTGVFSEVLFYGPNMLLPQGWRDLWHLASRIRRLKPQRLYYLAPTPRTRWQVWRDTFFFRAVCGIKDSRGMVATDGRVGQRDARGNPVPLTPEYLRLLRIASDVPLATDFGLSVGDAERMKVDSLWREHRIRPGARLIAMAPGGKWPAQRWPVERYGVLARELLLTFSGAYLIIIGGPQDSDIAGAISGGLGDRVVNCAGRLTVLQSAEALRRCSVYVGNNSGPMHLAAAMGTRCVAISSARDNPGIWDPCGDGHIVLRKDVPCTGCRLRFCNERALLCLTGITVEDVFQACSSVLATASCSVMGLEH
jgi:ADP-heptose:LPS heptosyltransferase